VSPRRAFAALMALVIVVVVGLVVFFARDKIAPYLSPDVCTAKVGDHTATLDLEQAENAGLIVAISVRRGMPARAASIALATAFQESKIRNVEHGDRDSVGLFQQRPSQGWGTAEQILDPVYATNRFYDELEKIDGYESMEITQAAQAVQRSGFPDAYAEHEEDARALASALTGNSRAAFSCEVTVEADKASDRLNSIGLVPRAGRVRRDLNRVFGELPMGGFAPGGVRDGHMKGSAHYDGRAVDVFFRPIGPVNKTRGWATASYLVSQADRLKVKTVIFDDRIWTSDSRSQDGWRDYDPPSRSGDRDIIEHRDHVHVDVYD